MFDSSKIGYSFPPFTVHVERTKLRELALAIGDPNPIYQDKGNEDIALPPTAATIFLFWENTRFIEQLAGLGLDVTRLIHREESYEYLAPIHAGETLTGVMTVLDGSTRKGRDGNSIDLVTLQLRYTNCEGRVVLVGTTRLVNI
ncbi:MAG TPA: MaoC family dehydratase N-terminal domain-containing protein [Ktedonobacteraceae bacterium]|nr:MaoC family dehydratase N-terminal domain-containing protein [Ktedonobacteraceae bacterium]